MRFASRNAVERLILLVRFLLVQHFKLLQQAQPIVGFSISIFFRFPSRGKVAAR